MQSYHVSNASVIRFSTPPAQTATFAFTGESGYTLSFAQRIAHKGSHAETGAFQTVVVSLPRTVPHVSETLRGQGVERQTLPLWGLGRGYSRRTQRACGTAMRSCALLSRGVAAPLGCVIFSVSVEIYGFTPRTQGFLCVRGGGGITTPGVRCVLPKFSAPACQSSLFAVF